MTDVVDAVVIGAGHHGLVAASMLADAGWADSNGDGTRWRLDLARSPIACSSGVNRSVS